MKEYLKITIILLLFASCKSDKYYAHRAYWYIQNDSNSSLNFQIYQNGTVQEKGSLKDGARYELFMYEATKEQVLVFSDIADIMDSVVVTLGEKHFTLGGVGNTNNAFFVEDNWEYERFIHDTRSDVRGDLDLYSNVWTFSISKDALE